MSLKRFDGEVEIHQPLGLENPALPRAAVVRFASYTCNHCNRVVMLNPQRTRDREWCSRCNRYICDGCGAVLAKTGECMPMAKLVAKVQRAAESNSALPKILVPDDVY
jgi:hypothetical protein